MSTKNRSFDQGASLIINTKNEEKNIKACILSAKSIVDEIIVVDMRSQDKTIEIAKRLGAKVYKIKDYGYVEPARNFALGKSSKEWTILLDADERLTPSLCETIRKFMIDGEYDGLYIPSKNFLLGKWIQHGMWWPDYKLKVFRSGKVLWNKKIHTQPKLSGEAFHLDPVEENAFVHYNIDDIDDLLKMLDSYSSEEDNFQSSTKQSVQELVVHLNKEFQWRYWEHEGYKDGIRGLVLAKFMDFYRFLELAKHWSKENYPEIYTEEELKMIGSLQILATCIEIEALKGGIKFSQYELSDIKSTEFFKLWSLYCKTRNLIKKKI